MLLKSGLIFRYLFIYMFIYDQKFTDTDREQTSVYSSLLALICEVYMVYLHNFVHKIMKHH